MESLLQSAGPDAVYHLVESLCRLPNKDTTQLYKGQLSGCNIRRRPSMASVLKECRAMFLDDPMADKIALML